MAPLARALQGAASKGIDVTAMRLNVVRNGSQLDHTFGEAKLTKRLAPKLLSTPRTIH